MKQYPNFDLIRLLLASSVLVLHWFAFRGAAINFWWLPWDAVPCFVAISGFLIAGSFERNPNVGRFMWKRACRLIPALISSLIMVAFLFGRQTVLPTLIVYFTAGMVEPQGQQNGVLWSLMVEEVLYASLMVMVLTGMIKRRWPVYVMLTVAVISLDFSVDMVGNYKRCAIAFLVGVTFYLQKDLLSRVKPYVWVGLVVLSYLNREDAHFQLPYFSLLPSFPFNLYLAFQATALLGLGAYGPKMWSRKLPDLSYGMYLYHVPILATLMKDFKDNRLLVALFAITFLVSLISAYAIERPFIRLKGLSIRKVEHISIPA